MREPAFLHGHALVWLDTGGCPGCTDAPWWFNEGEAALIGRLVQAMAPAPIAPGEEGKRSLVVLTPYRAQVDELNRYDALAGRIHTVHSFQGGQADRVVVSLVRTTRRGECQAANVGHVGKDEVSNVLLSRAQRLLIVVGDLGHFEHNAGPQWSTIVKTVRRYGHIQPAAEWTTP